MSGMWCPHLTKKKPPWSMTWTKKTKSGCSSTTIRYCSCCMHVIQTVIALCKTSHRHTVFSSCMMSMRPQLPASSCPPSRPVRRPPCPSIHWHKAKAGLGIHGHLSCFQRPGALACLCHTFAMYRYTHVEGRILCRLSRRCLKMRWSS